MEATLGVAAEAALPPYADDAVSRGRAAQSSRGRCATAQRTPGKVAIFTTCYVNYNEPGIGHDLVEDPRAQRDSVRARRAGSVLRHAEARARRPRRRSQKLKDVNIPLLAALARDGYAILTPVPSCTLMFKQELPLLFPDDDDVRRSRDAMFDPFEYFVLRDKDGLLRRDFKRPLGKVSYHIPCHSRVQNIGQKTREVLSGCPARRSTRSSAAPATTARGA